MRYYWRDGTPATPPRAGGEPWDAAYLEAMQQVEARLADPEYKRVDATTLPDGKWVSTVWLGLDHNWSDGPPVIFETMVFENPWMRGDLDSCRYHTEAEAYQGHADMVGTWRAKVTLWGRLWWLIRPTWLLQSFEAYRRRGIRRAMKRGIEELAKGYAKAERSKLN